MGIGGRLPRNSDVFTYTYDPLDRLAVENVPYSTVDIVYGYDLAGRMTSVADASGTLQQGYDTAGRLKTVTQADNRVIGYEYDAAGNRSKLIWPDPAYFVTYAYDALNRMTEVREQGDVARKLAVYTWDPLSRPGGISYLNGGSSSWTWPFDSNDLTTLRHDFVSGEYVAFDYTYHPNGDRKQQSVSNDRFVWQPAVSDSIAYATNALNQYPQVDGVTLSYDARGNLTSDGVASFTYDAKNRLTLASNPQHAASYAYDGLDRRISKTVDGAAVTGYALDGSRPIAEYNGAGTLLRRFVWGAGRVPVAVVASWGRVFLQADPRGSTVAVTSDADAVFEHHGYGPFGESDATGAVGFRFAGGRWDAETGLVWFGPRAYSAALGRFLQPDPTGYAEGPHLYTYARNNPIGRIDPTGTCSSLWDGFSDYADQGWDSFYHGVSDGYGSFVGAPVETTMSIFNSYPQLGFASESAYLFGAAVGLGRGFGAADDAAANLPKLERLADDVADWLGPNFNKFKNDAGDLRFRSEDNTRQIRFDINDFHGEPSGPHINLETFQRRNAYSGDRYMTQTTNHHIPLTSR